MLHEIRDERRVVFVDPKWSPKMIELKNFDHLYPVYDEEQNVWMGKDFVAYFRKRLNCSFRAMVHVRDFQQEQLELLSTLLFGVKELSLAVDELAYFVPAGSASRMRPQTAAVMFSGRHEKIKFTGTAQHPSLVNLMVKMNAERIRWFRMDEFNSLVTARRHMSRDFVSMLPSLPNEICVETSDRCPPFVDRSMVGKIKILGKRDPAGA